MYISDCGGKLCKNGGTLDLATCTCSCKTKPDEIFTWGGDECDQKICKTTTDGADGHEIAKLTGENCHKGNVLV